MIYKKLINIKTNTLVFFWKFLDYLYPKNFKTDEFKVIFIIEKADWAIRQVGTNIAKRINKNKHLIRKVYSNFKIII